MTRLCPIESEPPTKPGTLVHQMGPPHGYGVFTLVAIDGRLYRCWPVDAHSYEVYPAWWWQRVLHRVGLYWLSSCGYH